MEVSGHALGVPILVLGGATVIASRVRVQLPALRGHHADLPHARVSRGPAVWAGRGDNRGRHRSAVHLDHPAAAIVADGFRRRRAGRRHLDAGRVFVLADNAGGATSPVFVSNLAMGAVYFVVRSGLTTMGEVFEHGGRAGSIWRLGSQVPGADRLRDLSLRCSSRRSARIEYRRLSIGGPLLILACVTYRKSPIRRASASATRRNWNACIKPPSKRYAIAVDARSGDDRHIRRVRTARPGADGGARMRSDDDLRAVEAAALLHDIGKLPSLTMS